MFVDCNRLCHLGALALVLTASCTFGDFTLDAGITDASLDASRSDATTSDASVLDAAIVDGALADAAPADAAPADAAPADAAPADAAPADAAVPDASSADAGPHPIGPLGVGLSTLVGDSAAGFVDGARDFSLFNNPVNVLVGPSGDIFVADFNNSAIRQVTPAGVTVTLTAQPGFSRPFGMVFTTSGEFFVQTDHNSAGQLTGALYQVALDTGVATLRVDSIGRVRGMANLSDGRIVLADPYQNSLSIYNPSDDSVVDLAGVPGVAGYADGVGAAALFSRPADLAVTSGDLIYVSDSLNHRIRSVTLAGVVSTVAGTGVGTSMDGSASAATFSEPTGMALAGDGTLFICEFYSGLVRRLAGGVVTTIAGSVPGFADNSDPLLGQLKICEGIDFASDFLYISDGNGGGMESFHRVRRLYLAP